METITFDCNGYEITANVYFNFQSVTDLIAIIPTENKYFTETILFFKEKRKWITDSFNEKKFPATITSLKRSLHKIFTV
jgi:hypothetical protein